MFDRVVLCSEGKTLHAALRAKNLELANNDLVKVYLINESTLNSNFDKIVVWVYTHKRKR